MSNFQIKKAPRQGRFKIQFADYQLAEGVNNSLLDAFSECPAEAMRCLMNGFPPPTNPMKIGWLVDLAIFEPLKLPGSYYLRPEKYPAIEKKVEVEKDWSGNSNWCRQWMAEHADKPVVTLEELSRVQAMADAVIQEPKAKTLLGSAETQVSMFATCPNTGLQLKGRADIFGDGWGAELKATHDVSTEALGKQIANMLWHKQSAFYSDLSKLCGKPMKRFYFIAVKPTPPHYVNVRELEPSAIDLGRRIYEKQLFEFKACMDKGLWPGPSGDGDKIEPVDVPAWAYNKEMEDEPPLVLTFKDGSQYAL